jgi:putative ABC transport system permease protein
VKKMGLKEPVLGDKINGRTLIGVYQDFVYNNPSGIIAPMLISLKTSGFRHFFIRMQNDNHWRQTVTQIEKVTKQINPNFPFDYSFLKANYQQRFQEWNSLGFMAILFGCMAILIASLGLFGLSSFVAEQRGKEMSIRKVFGASAKSIWMLLSAEFLKPVFIALLIVIPASVWAASSFLSNITYHTALSWWMFAFAGFITLFIAIATVSFQAIKAAIANPVESLRSE